MKFDFCIGNPPYQEESNGENQNLSMPVYNKFLDAASEVADVVEMIHPARFLTGGWENSSGIYREKTKR